MRFPGCDLNQSFGLTICDQLDKSTNYWEKQFDPFYPFRPFHTLCTLRKDQKIRVMSENTAQVL